jgi:hypothetical protein
MKNIFLAVICAMTCALSAKSQDSTDLPIKNRIGIGCFPNDEKFGLAYTFGNKGQFIVQNNLAIDFYSYEIKFFYAWKSCAHKKLYYGAGVRYESFYSHDDNGLSAIVTPIGIEWHPIKRLRKFGIILEANLYYPVREMETGIRCGINYYF